MFFGLIFSVWTLMHVYVAWRGSSIPVLTRYLPRPAFLVIVALLWASYLLSRIVYSAGLLRLAAALEFVGSYWVGCLFLICLGLLATDLVTGCGLLIPRLAPTVRAWGVGAALVLCAIAMIQARRSPAITNYDVTVRNLPAERNGTVLVLLSDTHLGAILDENWARARIAQVQALHPDLIVLAGDIVEDHGAAKRRWGPILGRLSAPLGVWAVDGNHETFGVPGKDGVLQDAGVHLLHDHWEEAAPGLTIAGVDDLTTISRRSGNIRPSLDGALSGRPSTGATIFISHTPWPPDPAAYPGIGLMLSGHTHNGQIWPFRYVVKAIYPFVAGKYDVNGMPLIVCRGTGTWGPRMRLWGRGEIVRLVLHATQ